MKAIQLISMGQRLAKPPMVDLLFELQIQNDFEIPKWYVIPLHSDDKISFELGVISVEVLKACGQGCHTFAKVIGVGQSNFFAFYLKAGERLILEELPIMHWTSDDQALEATAMEIMILEQLQIESISLIIWIEKEWESDREVRANYKNVKTVGAKFDPDLTIFPIQVVELERLSLIIELER